MKKILILLLLPLFMGAGVRDEDAAVKVVFFKGTLKAAQEKAAREGKLVFIDFYASWCAPCKLMDEHTFSDPEIARYISDKYVPVKMNIDDFDGFEYKQQYNINLLPTLLITNCKGKEIQRKEEGLASSKLRRFLGDNYKSHNICPKPKPNVTVPRPEIPSPSPTTPTTRPKPSKPDAPVVKPPVRPTIPSTPAPTPPKPSVTPPKPPKPTGVVGQGLYRFAVQRQPSNGLSIQTGVFGEYGNVLREVDKLQRLFPEQPIIVYIAKKPTRTVYKILVGEFKVRAKAQDFKKQMKAKGVGGFVKDLRYMQ